MSSADSRRSRRVAIFVNLAKIALLAALAPPVVSGIAERASLLGGGSGGGIDTAAIVSGTVSTGSVCAVIGALVLGRLADTGAAITRSRWLWVLAGTVAGTVGLVLLACSVSLPMMVAGWALAQLGYSGAMAVLRAVLAAAMPDHRRRGAVVLVLGGYGGLLIPLAILILVPGSVWQTTLGLAAASLAVPLVFLASARPRTPRSSDAGSREVGAGSPSEGGGASAADAGPGTTAHDAGPPQPGPASLPPAGVLLVQFAANVVLAAFLSYHPLELAARAAHASEFPTRASVWVIGAAVLGLVGAAATLLWRPRFLARSRVVVGIAGAALAISLVWRALADPLPMIALAALVSGAAVGLNNSALLAAAMEAAPHARQGRYLGVFSAAGALGQFVGPLIALGILSVSASFDVHGDPEGYRGVFLALAVVPAVWAILTLRGGRNQRVPAGARTAPAHEGASPR